MFLAALGAAGAGAGAAGLTTALSIGGAALGAVGQIQQARAASSAARYNAALSERDAVVAEQNRQLALRTAQQDTDQRRREARRTLASIRANYGASGFMFAGSPLDVLQDTATELETDARRVQFEGQVRGREGALRVLGLREDAALSRARASTSGRAGVLGAIGTGLSGAGNILARTA